MASTEDDDDAFSNPLSKSFSGTVPSSGAALRSPLSWLSQRGCLSLTYSYLPLRVAFYESPRVCIVRNRSWQSAGNSECPKIFASSPTTFVAYSGACAPPRTFLHHVRVLTWRLELSAKQYTTKFRSCRISHTDAHHGMRPGVQNRKMYNYNMSSFAA